MEPLCQTHLTVRQLAAHWAVSDRTVRDRIKSGALPAQRFGQFWIAWPDIWAQENGPRPRPAQVARYRMDLLTRHGLAALTGRSLRTVDRWLAEGLPTRNVGGAVRINEADARDWLNARHGIQLF